MAITATAAIASQSIGTGSNVGSALFPQKITLQAATTALVLEARIVNGAGFRHDERQGVEVWYAVSNISFTAAAAVLALKQSAKHLFIKAGPKGLDDAVKQSDLVSAIGAYLYIWCEVPTFPVAAALSVSVLEP